VRHAKYNEIYDLYESENPGVKLSREFADFAGYFERLPTQFAGGNAPDVLHLTERQVADYAANDQLVDLQTLADDGVLDLQYFSDAALQGGMFNDKLVMLLIGATIPATIYNSALFEQAGVEVPETGWTWDDFAAKAVDLSDNLPEGAYGSTYAAISAPLFETMLIQDGKTLFAPDGSADVNFDAADGERWFSLWKELQDAGGCRTAEQTSEESGAPFEDTSFARGDSAIMVQNSNQLVTFQTAIGEDQELRLAEFPQLGRDPKALVIGSYVSINAGSKNIEESGKVIDFFVNDPRANKIYGMEIGVPGNSNWQEAIEADLAGPDRRLYDFHKEIESISQFATPRPPGSSRSETLMSELALAVGFGQLSPADAGARLVDELGAAVRDAV
jgi:multiple sugar transport system substrate-binding protein